MTTSGTSTPAVDDPVPGGERALEVGALLAAAAGGDRRSLARLLSAAERGGADGRAAAALAYRSGAEADTVGITGAPGSGKSTLVDRLIAVARAGGVGQLAVLAVDPTSPFSGGAILGDRVRMQGHDLDPGVFIRSMASRGHLGGLAVAVPEAIRLFAAAGMPLVLVETVGVGQVEVEVASATDTTVVVVNPRWGDSIQANKAGLLETGDIFVVNKADMPGAAQSRRDLEQMLDLSTPGDWRPPIVETVAATGQGVDTLWNEIVGHRAYLDEGGLLGPSRQERRHREFELVLRARIEIEIDRLSTLPRFAELSGAVRDGGLDPYAAAEQLLSHVGEELPSDTV
ncbi:MAG: methylmalonyl Co-A mutase-associated GTPase MeaB [Acidimicrobiales bacterium]